MKKKIFIPVIALALVICCAIGGTLAWLTATTVPVKNTFTAGNVNITLAETTTDYKMVPGGTISKDPVATVKANSEDCYLFVKVEKSSNFDEFMTAVMAEGWELVSDETNVYYRKVTSSTSDQAFAVLKDNQVTVKDSVTKDDLDKITEAPNDTRPTLTFTAYAVQLQNGDGEFTPAEAWAKVA